MKRVIINNPSKGIAYELRGLGLLDFFDPQNPKPELKGQSIFETKIEGISENAIFGNYNDIKLYHKESNKYNKKYTFIKDHELHWKSFTIDLSEKGIEILKQSGIKFELA